MYKTKKEIEDWIKKFNPEQVERMRADNYLDHINDDDLDGNERFRAGGNWSVELVAPQALLDLLPEWESKNWWEVSVVIDGECEEVFDSKQEALDEYGVKIRYRDNVSNFTYVKNYMSTFSFGTITKKAKTIGSEILMLALKRNMNCL
mgnify:CR=1 FL=1